MFLSIIGVSSLPFPSAFSKQNKINKTYRGVNIKRREGASAVIEEKLKFYLFINSGSSSVGLNDSTLLPQMLLEKKKAVYDLAYLNYFNHLLGLSVYNKMNHLKPLEFNSQNTAASKVD